MGLFTIPSPTIINRSIPKNSFEGEFSPALRQRLTNSVQKITWLHKLSFDTINLKGDKIEEIQIFQFDLKKKEDIKDILVAIDKQIPYHIIHILKFNDEYAICTSPKHPHVSDLNKSVIDFTFMSDWFKMEQNSFKLDLHTSLDEIYLLFCKQFTRDYLTRSETDSNLADRSIEFFVSKRKEDERLDKEIETLTRQIKACKQFNKRIELNLKLKELTGKRGK